MVMDALLSLRRVVGFIFFSSNLKLSFSVSLSSSITRVIHQRKDGKLENIPTLPLMIGNDSDEYKRTARLIPSLIRSYLEFVMMVLFTVQLTNSHDPASVRIDTER